MKADIRGLLERHTPRISAGKSTSFWPSGVGTKLAGNSRPSDGQYKHPSKTRSQARTSVKQDRERDCTISPRPRLISHQRLCRLEVLLQRRKGLICIIAHRIILLLCRELIFLNILFVIGNHLHCKLPVESSS